MFKNVLCFFFIFLMCFNMVVYSNNVLLPGESLRVNQYLTIEGDGVEWDRAVFSLKNSLIEHPNGYIEDLHSLELYVEKNGQMEVIWTSGELFYSWDQGIVTSLDMLPNGQLNVMYDSKWRPGIYLYQSFPEYPIFPIPGSYLILEESLSTKVRLALYSPMQELLWASDTNLRASNVLYSKITEFGDYLPGVVLNLKGMVLNLIILPWNLMEIRYFYSSVFRITSNSFGRATSNHVAGVVKENWV